MVCTSPVQAFSSLFLKENGKKDIQFHFKYRNDSNYERITLPCSKCIQCRLKRSREWAMRCVHELEYHQKSCFLTLTYDDVNLPQGGTLVLKHVQNFFRELRRKWKKDFNITGIRYLHCGEYGEKLKRPHYHIILYGVDFSEDKVLWKKLNGSDLFVSETLAKLWPYGFHTIGAVTFESAAYVARYITKKLTGSTYKEEDFEDLSPEAKLYDKKYLAYVKFKKHYGDRKPEYITMSRRPGLGFSWILENFEDVYKNDRLVCNGVAYGPPSYYDRQLEKLNPELYIQVKDQRLLQAKDFYDNLIQSHVEYLKHDDYISRLHSFSQYIFDKKLIRSFEISNDPILPSIYDSS